MTYMKKKITHHFADNIGPWMIWGYHISPMMHGQKAIVLKEFLDERWSVVRLLHNV